MWHMQHRKYHLFFHLQLQLRISWPNISYISPETAWKLSHSKVNPWKWFVRFIGCFTLAHYLIDWPFPSFLPRFQLFYKFYMCFKFSADVFHPEPSKCHIKCSVGDLWDHMPLGPLTEPVAVQCLPFVYLFLLFYKCWKKVKEVLQRSGYELTSWTAQTGKYSAPCICKCKLTTDQKI